MSGYFWALPLFVELSHKKTCKRTVDELIRYALFGANSLDRVLIISIVCRFVFWALNRAFVR